MSVGSPFTYKFFDLVTLQFIDELPLNGVSFGDVMNGAGTMSASVPIEDKDIRTKTNWNAATRPGRTVLVIEQDGSIVWDGIIWQRPYDSAKPGLPIAGARTWSYFQHREQAKGYTTQWQNDPGGWAPGIAQTILQDAFSPSIQGGQILGQPNGLQVTMNGVNPWLTTDQFFVTQSYPLSQRQTIDSIVSTLANMTYLVGFDYECYLQWVNDSLEPQIVFSYPRSGRIGSASPIVFDLSTVVSFTYPEDATNSANKWTVTGGRSGGIQAQKQDTDLLNEGWPLLENTMSLSGIHTVSNSGDIAHGAADAIVESLITNSCYPIVVPSVTTIADADPALGSFRVGDDARLVVSPSTPGVPDQPRFPNGLDQTWRIVRWTVSVPDDGGSPTMVVNFNQPPGLVAVEPPV